VSAAKPDPLAGLRRLTPRDRLLLSWLAEHYLLSTEQIATALFTSRRSAQQRLTILHRVGAVSRFPHNPADGDARGGTGQYLYTLGPLGVALHPTAYTDPDNPAARAPRSHTERRLNIARTPKLAHLLGTNQFVIGLHAHARRDPRCRVERWWSEHHATAVYTQSGICPDAHGIWRVGDTTAGWFLEYDNATENLARVITKLRAYERLAKDGPRYPVLLWVPTRQREQHLLDLLHGTTTAMPVATTTHCPNPGGAVWSLAGTDGPRLALHQLPSDHGPHGALNPSRYHEPHDDDPLPETL
jgi:hypothetical protein